MAFSLPPALLELKERVRRFVVEEVILYEGDARQTPHGPEESLRAELVARSGAAGSPAR
jgi:acyl-CoA dehydrogenase